MNIEETIFGQYQEMTYHKIILENDHQVSIEVTDLGARIVGFNVPLASGEMVNIVEGYQDAKEVFDLHSYYLGATVGRVAGRIADGQFSLNGETVYLDQNEGKNHLHGGETSIDLDQWNYTIGEDDESVFVTFEWTDPDGRNGYPGNVTFKVTHRLTNNNAWIIDYDVETDKETIVNPTNHVYFNLNANHETILNHQLQIQASRYMPVDDSGLPINEEGKDVTNSIFDLINGRLLTDIINSDDEQIKAKGGLDHPFILDDNQAPSLSLSQPDNKLAVDIYTTAPSVIIYTMNGNDPNDRECQPHQAIAIETQFLPNAMNFSNVPEELIINPGKAFHSRTVYQLNDENI